MTRTTTQGITANYAPTGRYMAPQGTDPILDHYMCTDCGEDFNPYTYGEAYPATPAMWSAAYTAASEHAHNEHRSAGVLGVVLTMAVAPIS